MYATMSHIFWPAAAIGLMMVALIGSSNNPQAKEQEPISLAEPLYEFGGKLLLALRKENATSNLVFSPISIHQALSMVLIGADQGSETRKQISNTIGYSALSDEQIETYHRAYKDIMSEFSRIKADKLEWRREAEIMMKNSEGQRKSRRNYDDRRKFEPVLDMFTMMVTKNGQRPRAHYANEIKQYFNSSISAIADAIPETKTRLMEQMNNWTKQVGFDGPIMKEEDLNDRFVALLITAISVEAFWFERPSLETDNFDNFGLDSERVTADFLSFRRLRAKYKEFKSMGSVDFRAIKVSLKGGISLTVLEPLSEQTQDPNTAKKPDPNAKLNKLTEELMTRLEGSQDSIFSRALHLLENEKEDLGLLRLPKFKFETDLKLKPTLVMMGLELPFDEYLAEISNITEEYNCKLKDSMAGELYINDVRHQAVFETTEDGIKAAAMTRVEMWGKKKWWGPYFDVKVRSPFVFLLRYKEVPLFIGQVTNLPKSKKR